MRKNGELKLYFVTTMTKLEDSKGYLETGAQRTVGYYETWEDAEQCVLTNNCDIFEYCYHFALVEEIGPGLYNTSTRRQFYRWNDEIKTYEKIDEPSFCKHYINFAIG